MLRLIVLLFFLITVHPAISEENYCNNQQTNDKWFEMLEKHPEDLELTKLAALRIGLCAMVDQQLIELDKAATIFESERIDLLEKRVPGGVLKHHDSEA